MDRREVTDDEVLQAMSAMGMPANFIGWFRATRNYLSYNMPLCCILFNLRYCNSIPAVPEPVMDMMADDNGLLGRFWSILDDDLAYFSWACEKAAEQGIEIYYSPCPACAIAGKFVEIPKGCPSCHDKEEHPEPEGDGRECGYVDNEDDDLDDDD